MSRGAVALLTIAVGVASFAAAWALRGDLVIDCRATLLAAELTQQGSERMMESCLDQSERLEVCELGQRAADKAITEIETELTFAQAQALILRKKCESRDEEPT